MSSTTNRKIFSWAARIIAIAVLLSMATWGCGDDNDNSGGSSSAGAAVRRTNLVSDVVGQTATTDANLVNAWGLARSASGPFWVADNHSGMSTVYNGSGQPFPIASPLLVTVPPPASSSEGTVSAPTGLVFNGTTDFVVSAGSASGPGVFIFATEDGTLSAWNQTVNAAAAILTVDNSGNDTIYKGLALATNGSANFLYATDFHNGKVDVFD
ncbi:MAG TPA: TIGR03118 family protein, partial [Candidatus Acidoferrales bacterium]|nr:TIGR03118 family protein [Candidatus Acidoferrales bacterium]